MKLTKLQFEERLRQASPGDTITVYVSSYTRHDTHTVQAVKGQYIYTSDSFVPVHFDHVQKLTAGAETWERK